MAPGLDNATPMCVCCHALIVRAGRVAWCERYTVPTLAPPLEPLGFNVVCFIYVLIRCCDVCGGAGA